MEGMSTSSRFKYFYPPTKSVMQPSIKPGEKYEAGHQQVYRKTGPIPQHRNTAEPYPPKRFHPGDPTDMFILKGGTAKYSETETKVDSIPEKDQANFFGVIADRHTRIGEQNKFGDNIMKFFGDGSKLKEKREQQQETIEAARSKFNHLKPAERPITGTMSIFGVKTLKQEKQEFGKITKTYDEVYREVYGDRPRSTVLGATGTSKMFASQSRLK